MKILKKDFDKGFVKLKVEDVDDLWYLSHIIDSGDYVKGETFRKIKIGESDSRNMKVIKRKIFVKINVEKIEFHKYSDILRVSGKITEGPEDISLGSYHTFNIESQSIFSLEKEEFLGFQKEKLDEACKPKTFGVLLCVFDREEAVFALMKNYGYEVLTELKGDVQKKADPESVESNRFYKDIIKAMKDYVQRYNINKIVVGSPAFWKEYLLKEIDEDELKQKIITASCNNIGKNGLDELVKRPEVVSALKDDRVVKETGFVEELLKEIKKDGPVVYGFNETKNAVDSGAVKELLISDALIMKLRQNDDYEKLDSLMKSANRLKADIHIISSENDAGKKLEGLGGIGAILRFKI